jgi:copper homeostasis protein
VFHRAFDFLPHPLAALDELIELGFERVLTSGGATTAEAGTTHLAALVQHAGWQLEVLPAGTGAAAHGRRPRPRHPVRSGPRRAAARRSKTSPPPTRPGLAAAMGATDELDYDAVVRLRAQLDALGDTLT